MVGVGVIKLLGAVIHLDPKVKAVSRFGAASIYPN